MTLSLNGDWEYNFYTRRYERRPWWNPNSVVEPPKREPVLFKELASRIENAITRLTNGGKEGEYEWGS